MKVPPEQLITQVSQARIQEDLNFLAKVRHPEAGLAHLESVKDYIEDRFRALGLEVERQEFEFDKYTAHNIIATWRGTGPELPEYLHTAHFDSVHNSPGADDNASAVAGLLEGARLLVQNQYPHTIRFVAFDLEEHDLAGSRHFVRQLKKKVAGVLNYEMIGYYDDAQNSQKLPNGFEMLFPAQTKLISENGWRGNFLGNIGNVNSAALHNRFDEIAQQYMPGLRVFSCTIPGNGELAPDLRRSDHTAFWEAGIPALMLTDTSNFRNPNYHSPSDTVETLNVGFIAKVVAATVSVLAVLAGKRGM